MKSKIIPLVSFFFGVSLFLFTYQLTSAQNMTIQNISSQNLLQQNWKPNSNPQPIIGNSQLVEPSIKSLKSVDPCDPASLGHPNTPASILRNRSYGAVTGDFAMRWCFTFDAAEAPIADGGGGTLQVIQHIVVERYTGTDWEQVNSAEFELTCERSGQVGWDAKNEFITFKGHGKIECTTVDLRTETLNLSKNQYDICNGATACELAITEVVNYVTLSSPTDSPSHDSHQFLNGPLFIYEEVKLGGTIEGDNIAITLKLNNDYTQAIINPSYLDNDLFLSIEQVDSEMLYGANSSLINSAPLSEEVTHFNSSSETIIFGFDPVTEEYLKGSIKNGIFDPYSGSGSAY